MPLFDASIFDNVIFDTPIVPTGSKAVVAGGPDWFVDEEEHVPLPWMAWF